MLKQMYLQKKKKNIKVRVKILDIYKTHINGFKILSLNSQIKQFLHVYTCAHIHTYNVKSPKYLNINK